MVYWNLITFSEVTAKWCSFNFRLMRSHYDSCLWKSMLHQIKRTMSCEWSKWLYTINQNLIWLIVLKNMINDWSEIRINQTHATTYRKRLKSRVELLSSLGSCSPRAELKFRQTFLNVLELVDVILHEIPSSAPSLKWC